MPNLLLLTSTTDQTSHFRMRPVLFPPKRSNEQDSMRSNISSSQLLNPSTAECILSTADLLYVQISTVHKISTVHQLSTVHHPSTVHFQLTSAHLGVSRGVTLLATGDWLQPESQGDWLFTPALEGLTRSARTDSPRKVGRNKFRRGAAAAAAACEKGRRAAKSFSRTSQNPPPILNTLSSVSVWESRIQYMCDPQWFRDTASRGPTTIVALESQFRTCPSDHDLIHLTAAQLLMTSRLLKSSISLDDVTTAEIFNKLGWRHDC
ncbi:hypothetical protein F511_20726 [Dorcoceras hygrometricum]|uniref:Uncharacterized protein n=1 Tax=Dorcoceras hygrometricum TaxID=472368 RepID=A0A2Z7APU4_9LAMI|nr:hypothetical protein F511_20726 [Dorcoceras hygrometricum]